MPYPPPGQMISHRHDFLHSGSRRASWCRAARDRCRCTQV